MVLYFAPDNGHEYEEEKSMDSNEFEEREDEEETYKTGGETQQSLQRGLLDQMCCPHPGSREISGGKGLEVPSRSVLYDLPAASQWLQTTFTIKRRGLAMMISTYGAHQSSLLCGARWVHARLQIPGALHGHSHENWSVLSIQ